MNSNAERFTGFADIYDQARPHLPAFPREVIRRYLGHAPDTVVDLGCGTGLSTAAWIGECRQVIGIEPSADMLGIAQKKAGEGIRFRQAFAHDTGLADGIADAIICSQSFHWMEPVSTLREVHRLLAPGGVFTTVDCDWPPMCGYEAEKAYQALFAQVRDIETGHPDIRSTFTRWEKEKHLAKHPRMRLFCICSGTGVFESRSLRCAALYPACPESGQPSGHPEAASGIDRKCPGAFQTDDSGAFRRRETHHLFWLSHACWRKGKRIENRGSNSCPGF